MRDHFWSEREWDLLKAHVLDDDFVAKLAPQLPMRTAAAIRAKMGKLRTETGAFPVRQFGSGPRPTANGYAKALARANARMVKALEDAA